MVIEKFFQREDVSRVSPDIKQLATNPENKNQKSQVRFMLGYLKTLHSKFEAEVGILCAYETFTRLVPYYIRKPKASDWGTCLCAVSLNPKLKLERLSK